MKKKRVTISLSEEVYEKMLDNIKKINEMYNTDWVESKSEYIEVLINSDWVYDWHI